jgi:hypothetical protein
VNVDDVLAHLARTPEEQHAFFAEHQRAEYERWWRLQEIAAGVQGLTALSDEEASEVDAIVATSEAEQAEVHVQQAERVEILARLSDYINEME